MITSNTWDTNTVSRLHLLALILGRIEVVKDKSSCFYLTRKELKEYGFQKGDTEGFVNYGLSIAGVKMAAFFMEDLYEDFIKISFRSKDDGCESVLKKIFQWRRSHQCSRRKIFRIFNGYT
jgi:phosphoesterase RecJ-like protein